MTGNIFLSPLFSLLTHRMCQVCYIIITDSVNNARYQLDAYSIPGAAMPLWNIVKNYYRRDEQNVKCATCSNSSCVHCDCFWRKGELLPPQNSPEQVTRSINPSGSADTSSQNVIWIVGHLKFIQKNSRTLVERDELIMASIRSNHCLNMVHLTGCSHNLSNCDYNSEYGQFSIFCGFCATPQKRREPSWRPTNYDRFYTFSLFL